MKIIGYTVGTTLPKPSLAQTDPTKGDYIKDKDILDTKYIQSSAQVAYINETDNEIIENPNIETSDVIIDPALSETSTNPVQNKVITEKFSELSEEIADKVNKNKIAHGAGNSEELVMSQKGVTELVNNALDKEELVSSVLAALPAAEGVGF